MVGELSQGNFLFYAFAIWNHGFQLAGPSVQLADLCLEIGDVGIPRIYEHSVASFEMTGPEVHLAGEAGDPTEGQSGKSQRLISPGAAKGATLDGPFAVSFHLFRTFRNLIVNEFYFDSEASVLGISYEQCK